MLLADAMHRFHQLIQSNRASVFSTGTDEHGQKVAKAAAAAGVQPITWCDSISAAFQSLARDFDVGPTHFVRTTQADHVAVAQSLWRRLRDNGFLYKDRYEGWYCVADESFATSVEDAVVDGKSVKVSSESGRPVEWMQEENYMFRMSNMTDHVRSWLDQEPSPVYPAKFADQVKSWLSSGPLHDLSVSRPRARLDWGVAVPDDADHTIYVWVEALASYLTAAAADGSGGLPVTSATNASAWPADVQVIGKDILKFHAIYWPALLMAAGLEPPKRLLVHSHWTIEGRKMSKSDGNVVDPRDLHAYCGREGLRYYLLREAVLHEDGRFSRLQLQRCLNSELGDTLGNLLSRCTAPAVNRDQVVWPIDRVPSDMLPKQLRQDIEKLPNVASQYFHDGYFNRGIEECMSVLRDTNAFVHSQAPWSLAKQVQTSAGESVKDISDRLQACLAVSLEAVRVASILLQPIIPITCGQALDKLSVPLDQRTWQHADAQSRPREEHKLSPHVSAILFRKLRDKM